MNWSEDQPANNPLTSPTYVDRLDLNEGPVEMNKEPLNRKFSGKLNPTTDMTLAEKSVIWELAQGDRRKLHAAVAIHHKYISSLGVRGTPEQRYMAEVDNPAPDRRLKEDYRIAMLRGRQEYV